MATTVVRVSRAFEMLGVGRTRGYEAIDDGTLPRFFKVGKRAAALLESEIEAINAARAGGATDEEMRHLVDQLHRQRAERAASLLGPDRSAGNQIQRTARGTDPEAACALMTSARRASKAAQAKRRATQGGA